MISVISDWVLRTVRVAGFNIPGLSIELIVRMLPFSVALIICCQGLANLPQVEWN
jgi:hypothetical protein